MSRKTSRRAYAALDALYARLPSIACRGLCAIACGPIPMTTLEAERLRKTDPGRRLPMVHATPVSAVSCVYLTAGHRCGVYAARPLICRVWGVVQRMSCMFGCLPDRWLTDHEFVAIAKAVEQIGGPIVVSTPEGVVGSSDSFQTIDTDLVSPEEAEALADKTRVLRVLHGGYVMGLHPSEREAWVDLSREKPKP